MVFEDMASDRQVSVVILLLLDKYNLDSVHLDANDNGPVHRWECNNAVLYRCL